MADESATEPLPGDVAHLPPPRPSSPAVGTPVDLVGRTLGKFTIVERLGAGGSGEVFRAEQTQLGRSAVIKVLRRDIAAGANRIDRFLREAKLASKLDHPYAAHVYAFGAEPDGVLWIAMEYVRGATLDELVVRRGAIPPAIFGPLFVRLCEVVHTAHDLGIVHRDIKGSNVMVIERAGQLLPKLLDFGIAKGLDGAPTPSAPGDTGITMSGATLGSPHYMAPEQWRSAADVDARADIYALGVLAYRCVAGRLPFGDVERAGLAEAHMLQPPPPLPAAVPLATSDVILRALAKEPSRRWPTALAFAEGMRRAAGGAAPEAVPMLDMATRDTWFRGGPQPIADAVARLSRASTTVEADAALRELVAITCRWLAVLGLAQLGGDALRSGEHTPIDGASAQLERHRRDADPRLAGVREAARAVVGRDDAAPWVRLARAALAAVDEPVPGIAAAIAGAELLEQLADRLDDRDRAADTRPSDEFNAPSMRSGMFAPVVSSAASAGRRGIVTPRGDELRPPEEGTGEYRPYRRTPRFDEYRPTDGDPDAGPGAASGEYRPYRGHGPGSGEYIPARTTSRRTGRDGVTDVDEVPVAQVSDAPGSRSGEHAPSTRSGEYAPGGRSGANRFARTAAGLAFDVAALSEAMEPLESMLAYQLVVGRATGAESWQGPRRRDRERVVVWGEPLGDGEVAMLDASGRVVATLSPLVQVSSPLPSAEPELFLLWRSGRGAARLVAAPWGFERDDEAVADALAALTTEDTDTLAETGDDSPYPGLAAYGVGDADRFVGREREVEALSNRLVRAPLIAVLGPSGAGKSSFLHAGVLPRLAEHYEIITMRPGRHPLHALAALPPIASAIGPITPPSPTSRPPTSAPPRAPTAPAMTATPLGDAPSDQGDDISRIARADEDGAIVARLRELGERAPRGLVIVIDQLEELVTLCSDTTERRRFAGVLAAAADDPTASVRVAVTLRDDFASVIESIDAFRGRFDVFVLATPSPEALRRIVIEPAKRAGVAVDARVVDDMVAEIAGRPASLPLLSFTASRLWHDRDRAARRITHDAYLALGGVAGALSTYADQVYGSLAPREQEVLRELFARLVAADGTRIPAPRKELEQLPGAAATLAHLIDARLLVVCEDAGVDVVEIVHECLAERWPRLARWRSEDAADRALLGDVRAAARRWQDSGRRPDLLWRGEALAELRRLTQHRTSLTPLERAFADACDRAARRSRRLRGALLAVMMAGFAGAALVMAYLGAEANRSRNAAEDSAQDARASARLAEERLTESLIAQGRRELNDQRALAALAYFAEALRRGADSPALRFMISMAARGWPYEVIARRSGASVTQVESSPEGWAVSSDTTGKLTWWSDTGALVAEQPTDLGLIVALVREADARGQDWLVVVGRKAIGVVDPKAHRVVHRVVPKSGETFGVHLGPAVDELSVIERDAVRVYDLAGALRRAFTPDKLSSNGEPHYDATGAHLAYATAKEVRVIDLVAMTERTIAKNNDGSLGGSADGSTLGYVDADGVAHVLTGDGTELRTFRPGNRPHSLMFSPTGDRIGALSEATLAIHDKAGKPLFTVPVKSQLVFVEMRGDDVWLGTTDGVVQRWAHGTLVASLPAQLGDLAQFHVGEKLVMTVGMDGGFVAMRRDSMQIHLQPKLCGDEYIDIQADGIGAIYRCNDGKAHVFVGAKRLADVGEDDASGLAYHEPSGRGALAGRAQLAVYERGVRIAVSEHERDHFTNIAFEDAGHVLVTRPEDDVGVWRWTIDGDRWERAAAVAKAGPVVMAAGGMFVGTANNTVVRVEPKGGTELGRVDVGGRPLYLAASRDGAWVVASLQNGVAVILDGATGAIVRQLEPTDSLGGTAAFDPTGALILRPGRQTMTVWDRATGDNLVWNLDVLRTAQSARFDATGRLEIDTWEIGVLDLPSDRRPAAAIRDDIDCRVPLRVVGSRLGPATPSCEGTKAFGGRP